jgi:hypothetical protein
MTTVNIVDNTEEGFLIDPFDDHGHVKDPVTRILAVYQDVWNEFYSWEGGHCATTIDELLAIPTGLLKIPGQHWDLEAFEIEEGMDLESTPSDNSFAIFNYDSRTKRHLNAVTIPFRSPIEPHPCYQMCTPISRNIAWRIGDWNDQINIPFLPYSNEERFDMHEYLTSFEGTHPPFEWQNMIDPDRKRNTLCFCYSHIILGEMIELETVRRLQYLCHLTIEEIGQASVIPALRSPEDGIIWHCAQRYTNIIRLLVAEQI